jgi:hypothetical protein
MKKIYQFLLSIFLLVSFTHSKAQTFTVGSVNGNYALNCNTTVITMTTNSGYTPYSYTWTSASSTLYTNYANITTPGNWTVFGQSMTSTVSSQQIFTITSASQAPTIAITPTVMNITCSGGAGCFTLTSNLGPNVTTNWYRVDGTTTVYTGVQQGTINIFCPGQPGTYWGVSENNFTGCRSTKSVQVTSSVGVPQFTVISSTDFTLGCGSNSVTSITASPVITSPVASVPCSFSLMIPPVTATPSAFVPGPNFNNLTIPGLYVMYVKDQTNNCLSSMSITVWQNTTPPTAYISQPVTTLSCTQPSVVLTGLSSNTNTTMSWNVPSSTIVISPTLAVNTNTGVANSSASITPVGVYTLNVTDNATQCVGTRTLSVTQDIRKPLFTISALSNSVITCNNPSVTIVPIITPFIAMTLVPTFTWYPPPSGPGFPGTQYNTITPGTHTAINMSTVNGCTATANYGVSADLVPPPVAGGTLGVSCPFTGQATITPVLGSTINLTYTWTSFPSGAVISATNKSFLVTDKLGDYVATVTNTVNGCSQTVTITIDCSIGLQNRELSSLAISCYPNPSNGIFNIEVNSKEFGIQLAIYDVQGKILVVKPLNEGNNAFYTNLPKGCYFYKITHGEMVLKRDKLLIE